jgi:hypothetical protein
MNSELGRIWKEAVMAWVRFTVPIYIWMIWRESPKSSVIITDAPVVIRTDHILNTSLQGYSHDNLISRSHLWNLKVHCRLHNSSTFHSVLSPVYPGYILKLCFFKVTLNTFSHLCLGLPFPVFPPNSLYKFKQIRLNHKILLDFWHDFSGREVEENNLMNEGQEKNDKREDENGGRERQGRQDE